VARRAAAGSPSASPPGDARSWTVTYRVRFDEAAPDGLVRPGVLLAYAQDCAWVHSTALGFDRAWYAARGLAWLVRAVRLDLRAAIPSGGLLTVRTEVVGFRAASARRRTAIGFAGFAGPPVAELLTDWALTDGGGRPVRVPAEILARFEAAGAEQPSAFAPLRIRAADDGPAPHEPELRDLVLRDLVRWSDADPMGHLNNGRAVDLVDEALARMPDGRAVLERIPRRYLLEYRAPLPVGTAIALGARRLEPEPGGSFWVEARTEARTADAGRPAIVALVSALETGAESEPAIEPR
jgi:acyl-CoA thioesterase FadM